MNVYYPDNNYCVRNFNLDFSCNFESMYLLQLLSCNYLLLCYKYCMNLNDTLLSEIARIICIQIEKDVPKLLIISINIKTFNEHKILYHIQYIDYLIFFML